MGGIEAEEMLELEPTETLFADVQTVKNQLRELDLADFVDVNEIFESLESHCDREDRVAYVVSLFVQQRTRVRDEHRDLSNFNSADDELESYVDVEQDMENCHAPPEANAIDMPDFSEHQNNPSSAGEYDFLGVKKDDLDSECNSQKTEDCDLDAEKKIFDAGSSSSEKNEVCVVDLANDINAECNSSQKTTQEYDVLEEPVPGCSTSFPAPTLPHSTTTVKLEPVVSQLPQQPSQDFNYDVNNNDPNNNTVYEEEAAKESKDSDSDYDSEDIAYNQEMIRKTLLKETNSIHQIVPDQSFGQIYAYLEANIDNPNRVQVVTRVFLDAVVPNAQEVTIIPGVKANGGNPGDMPSTSRASVIVKNETDKPSTSKEPILIDLEKEEQALKRRRQAIRDVILRKKAKKNAEADAVKLIQEVINLDSDGEEEKGQGSSKLATEDPLNIASTSQIVAQIPVELGDLGECASTENVQHISKKKYKILKEMFPHVTRDYINEVCSKLPPNTTDVDDIATYLLDHPEHMPSSSKKPELLLPELLLPEPLDLSDIIDRPEKHVTFAEEDVVLSDHEEEDGPENDDNLPDDETVPPEDQNDQQKDPAEARYQYLIAVFPDADPTYLRTKCEEIGDNDEQMREFIATTLERKDYPTYSDYCKRQKESDLYKRFTENFTVESFLELFPEPVKHFEKMGPTEDQTKALEYLKNRFRSIRVKDITSTFIKTKCNLARTCATLKRLKSLMKTPRAEVPHDWSGCKIGFIQEVAFVENREKIEEFLQARKAKRETDFAAAKARGELLECCCCYGDEFLPYDMSHCEEGHLFCKECIIRSTEIAIGEGKTSFRCLTNCESEFSLKILQAVLKPSVFSSLLQKKQLEEVLGAGIEGLETCQYCSFATIPAEGDKVFHCQNPECMKETCRLCKEPNHIPLRCEEVEKSDEIRVRTMIEDRMTEALVRTCWKCKKTFVKEDGCNKMTCVCGALMCYVCRQPVKDYTHFNGQGGTEFHKCPLYSNTNELHVEAVKKAAEKAKKEVLKENPNVQLKVDPTKNLPKEEPNRGCNLFRGFQFPPGFRLHNEAYDQRPPLVRGGNN